MAHYSWHYYGNFNYYNVYTNSNGQTYPNYTGAGNAATANTWRTGNSYGGNAVMSYPPYGNTGYSYPPGYSNPYAQQQQYQPTPPQIRNPFAPPPPATGSTGAAYNAQNASYDPDHEAQLAQWQSTYAPQEQQDKTKKDVKGKYGVYESASTAPAASAAGVGAQTGAEPASKPPGEDARKTVVRQGGGQTWQDDSLLEWDPTQFRIMVGNLAGEVTDDSLAKAFAQYGVSKARVIRDKRTTKSKGFGFVSFTDGEQGFKAAREMVGKYIGSHPVTIKRSKTDLRPVAQKDSHNKHGKGKNNKNQKGQGKDNKKENDPLRANTGAHIEKKPVKNPSGLRVIG